MKPRSKRTKKTEKREKEFTRKELEAILIIISEVSNAPAAEPISVQVLWQ